MQPVQMVQTNSVNLHNYLLYIDYHCMFASKGTYNILCAINPAIILMTKCWTGDF